MKPSRTRSLYPLTSGAERFRLALAALARGDLAEHAHLLRTRPVVTVRMTDPDFDRHALATLALVHALLLRCAPYVGWLDLLEILNEPVWEAIDLLLTPPLPKRRPSRTHRSEREGFPLMAMKVAGEYAAAQVKLCLEAFFRVCREEASLDPEHVLGAMAPFLGDALAPHQALMASVQVAAAEVDEACQDLAAIWWAWLAPETP